MKGCFLIIFEQTLESTLNYNNSYLVPHELLSKLNKARIHKGITKIKLNKQAIGTNGINFGYFTNKGNSLIDIIVSIDPNIMIGCIGLNVNISDKRIVIHINKKEKGKIMWKIDQTLRYVLLDLQYFAHLNDSLMLDFLHLKYCFNKVL